MNFFYWPINFFYCPINKNHWAMDFIYMRLLCQFPFLM